MEILIGMIVVTLIIFIIGGMHNDHPIADWSDEKLIRIRSKLQKLAIVSFDAGNIADYKKLLDKKQEIDNEIIKRERLLHERQVANFIKSSTLGDDDAT